AEDPAANLAKAADLYRVLQDPRVPMPIELHYLAILTRDAPNALADREYAQAVGLALRLRRAAERTALAIRVAEGITDYGYPYSEEVYPWIRPQVEAADQKRRLGEDLLFAGDSASWKQALSLLQDAQAGYDRASDIGLKVNSAMTLADLVQADLP